METPDRRPIIVIAGPTASGKSKAALDVAEAFDGAIINADSMQVYRELRVLTERPGLDDICRVPHFLYGVLPAAEVCSAGRWLEMATAAIAEVRAMGRLPVVVGGTGLYLRALMEGLSPIPEVPEAARTEARRLHGELGPEAFRERLAAVDPEAAGRLPAGDTQRLIRAYEVAIGTGRTQADWQAEEPAGPAVPGWFASIVLVPPRDALYAAVDVRFQRMMERGALEEVKALLALGLAPELPAMKAVGVRELAAVLKGEVELPRAVEEARRATRHYAKRQFTWLRHQLVGSMVISAQYSECNQPEMFSFIRHFVLTTQS